MTLANTAFDLARYARGRFVLGLGSQVKPHIETPVLDAVVPPRGPHARVRRRAPGDLGELAGRRQARLPRRLLHPHPDDALLLAVAPRVGRAARLPRRRGQAHDRGRGRGVRRLLLPRVHHSRLPARGHAARARTRPRGRRPRFARRLRRSPGPRSPASGAPTRSSPPPYGAPRSRSRSTRRPLPTGACSSTTDGATCSRSSPACRRRASGRRWATSSTTTSCAPSPRSVTSPPWPASCGSAGTAATRLSFYMPYRADASVRTELLAELTG